MVKGDDAGVATADVTALQEATDAAFRAGGALAVARSDYQRRDAQAELAARIAVAIDTGGSLLAEAGTGIGKTFAYLVPALLARRRVLIATGTRQLQDQLFQRDVGVVRRALGVDASAAVLKGRANYVCPLHLKRNLADGRFRDRGAPAKLRIIERFAAGDQTGDRAACTELSEDDPVWALATSTKDNCLGQECPELRQCPLMKARQKAQRADVLIVNHHLFCADLALKEDAIGDFLPRADIFIFDEAHQLPDIATEFFGDSVSTRQLVDLSRDCLRAGLTDAAGAADWRGVAASIEMSARRLRLALPEQPVRLGAEQLLDLAPGPEGSLLEAVQDVAATLDTAGKALQAQQERSLDLARCALRAEEICLRAAGWSAQLEAAAHGLAAPSSIVWAQTTSNHAVLKSTPLSVAERLAEQRQLLGGSWIFLSATLAVGPSLQHFARAVGLPEAEQAILPSPFDYSRQAGLWVADQVGPVSAPDFPNRVARRIWPLIQSNQGRAFVLCTTLRAVRIIADELLPLAGNGLLVLTQGDAPRHELLQRFRNAKAAVLVGAAGFWEGVDVVGDQLSLVVIDKLPFAPPDDPVLRARSRAVEAAGGNSFAELSLPAAAMALKQGAGRLIRSELDRGLLVICDERLSSRSYGRQLLASIPPFRRVSSLQDALACLPR
jgi:ATP-dependent DNA helicase DinG